jgi:hypothetical protein
MICRTFFTISSLTFFASANAFAFCPTTTCAQDDPKPAECVPGIRDGNCQKAGEELYWAQNCGSFSVYTGGSPKLGITATQLEQVGTIAFSNWLNVDCPGGGKPSFRMETYPQVDCAEVNYNKSARNQNVWVFRDEVGVLDSSVIGLTSVIFEPTKGEIYDVDMELNSAWYTFSVGDISGGYNLQAVVQHETGHVLGLAHSDNPESTMLTNYDASVDMSVLSADDIAGICYLHPPTDSVSSDCDAEPRHGFSKLCHEPMAESGCSCKLTGYTKQRNHWASLCLVLGGLLTLSTRRRFVDSLRKAI